VIPARGRAAPLAPRRRWSWRGKGNGLIAIGLASLLALVSGTAPRWSRFLRQPLQASEEEFGREALEALPSPTAAQRSIKVKLFFESADGGGLVLEERDVPYAGDLARQVEIAVEELIKGSHGQLLPPLPVETRVLGAFVTRAGVAYVNLSKEALGGGAGTRTELLSVFSVVNSLTSSFPAIKRVQLLVDDRPVETLWGHVDVNRPLPADLTQLGVLEALPLGTPSASSAPAEAAPSEPAPSPATP